jgi:GT2 family glycosyltransferase/glycosyltransferase involved in cell wall biosynthesis
LEAALRLADCACRIAPNDPACILLHARLLTQLGSASEAAERLRDREEPECIIARADALCALRSWDESAASCQVLLRQRAVDELENLQHLASRLCRVPESNFPGWIGVDTKVRLVGQVRTGVQVKITISDSDEIWFPIITAADQDGLDCFQFDVPAGISGPLTVCAGNLELIGSGLGWPPEFGLQGWVVMENQTLLGEVRLDWAPSLPVTLVIGPSGRESIRPPVAPSINGSVGSPFSVPLHDLEWKDSPLEVSAVLPDGTPLPLVGSPVGIQPITPTPVQMRPTRTIPLQSDQEREPKHKVDIVIPVFAGREETLACIESALATTMRHETELVVVNDASPDSELCAALARFADDGRITLLTNRTNLGFPGSANKGMNLHPERDVVLLNADTELFGSWLKRLQRAAYSAGDIGTATPLGEAASIVSYPGKSARTHTSAEAEEIDRIAGEVNARKVVELPVGVGLCLYIKRACLGEVGHFDETNFGKGCGEENDFCLRARSLGWRHVAATDLFVRHHGARSFGAAKRVLKERNRRVLNAFHPGYDTMIAAFAAADPLLNARRAIDTHRLLKKAVDPVLLLTFHLPGGVKRHVEEREAALRGAGHTVIVLKPGTSGKLDEANQDYLPHNRAAQDELTQNQVILTVQDSGLENLAFNLPEGLPLLRALLLKLGLSGIELHHFAGLPGSVLEMVAGLDIRYDVHVHDYCWICPRLSLVGENGGYCGEPAVEDCETCIRERGTALEKSLTVRALRARSARILEGARTVIVPSTDVRTRLARYFPALPITVMGWEKPIIQSPRPLSVPPERVHVALIGAISVPKGQEILLQCVRDAIERDLDLDFVVIGFTSDDEALLATGRVFITGPYSDDEIGFLLEREQPHVAFFPSIVPETWSYALSHVLTWGLPVVAFDLGAIAERLRDDPMSELLPLWTTPAKINDALLRSARRITISEELKELAMDPTPTTTQQSKTNNEPVPQELAASVQVLTLPVGTYAFTVQGGASAAPSAEGLMLPALQVGLAPGKSEGTAEFLTNATTVDRWLAGSSDMVIVRIFGGSASLLLTSLRSPSSAVLAIEVRPVDAPPRAVDPESAASQSAHTAPSGALPVHIVAHIHQVGDVHFGNSLVGCLGDRLWIEAFSILSVGELPPDAIEYCGVTSDGFQTPWLSNQMLCGSRGRGMPLMGYALRLKPEVADRYECTYTGRFVSGSKHGPCVNGDLCSSEVPGDALWGIELRIAPRGANDSKTPGTEMQYSTVG